MKHLPLFLLVTFLLGACGSTRHLTESVNKQDSVRVEVHTRTEYVLDTVFIEIPQQTSERETADSVSHLENDYATSDARINVDGSLFHNLKTKPQKKPTEVKRPVEQRDSIVYKIKTETVTEVVEVPRKLSWWQKTQIYGFWLILSAVVIRNRKKIFRH